MNTIKTIEQNHDPTDYFPSVRKFETQGGTEIVLSNNLLGQEPKIVVGDIIAAFYEDEDLVLYFFATEDEKIETTGDHDGEVLDPSENSLDFDTTTTYETKGSFFVSDEAGFRLIGKGVWYAPERCTTFFQIFNEEGQGLTLNRALDHEVYEKIRKFDLVTHTTTARETK